MSRFHCDEWDGEGVHPLMWEQTCRNAIRGQKGQAILRELKEALLELPQPRLIEGAMEDEGEVCALGALARKRVAEGARVYYEGDALDEEWDTVEIGERMGLKRALAWAISYENDEGTWANETPEQRYWRMLRWVESNLIEQPN